MKNYTGYEIFKINQAVLRLFKKYLIIKYGTEGKREEPRGQTTHITDERVLLQGRGRPYPRA